MNQSVTTEGVKMFRAVVLFCAVLALTKGQTTEVSRCISITAGPLPIKAYIAGCVTPPCLLPQGQDAVIQVVFRAPHVIHRMRTVAMGYISVTPFPYPLGEKAETCNFLNNTYCPVFRDEIIMYTLNIAIKDFMPVGTQLPIEFSIIDDDNSAVMCIRVAIRIVAPLSKFGAQNATLTVEV